MNLSKSEEEQLKKFLIKVCKMEELYFRPSIKYGKKLSFFEARDADGFLVSWEDNFKKEERLSQFGLKKHICVDDVDVQEQIYLYIIYDKGEVLCDYETIMSEIEIIAKAKFEMYKCNSNRIDIKMCGELVGTVDMTAKYITLCIDVSEIL